MNKKLLLAALMWLPLLCLSLQPLPVAAMENLLETRIKASFIYKFCQYVSWPDSLFETPASPIVITVAGADNLARELRLTVAGRRINDRAIEVYRLRQSGSVSGSHILFIGSDRQWLNSLAVQQNPHLLTVTELADNGSAGIINFVVVNNRVRFDIAQDKAEQAGLKLSSQLLSVARQVNKGDN